MYLYVYLYVGVCEIPLVTCDGYEYPLMGEYIYTHIWLYGGVSLYINGSIDIHVIQHEDHNGYDAFFL